MEGEHWVCDDALEDNEWVSELNISITETDVLVVLNNEIDVQCVVQWGLLWFSSLATFAQSFGAKGREKIMKVEKMAIEAPHTLSIGGPHTQRTGERAVLYRSTNKRLGTGGIACAPTVNDHSGTDLSDEKRCMEPRKALSLFVSKIMFSVSSLVIPT